MIFCFSYTKLSFNIISFILTFLLIFIECGIYESTNKLKLDGKMDGYYQNTNEITILTNEEKIIKNTTEKNKIENTIIENLSKNVWKIEIPKINLKANISEGTTEENLNKYVGHFEETSKLNGNIGLAAHNRGYNVNYFSRIKELENGDEIYYTYNGVRKKYIVNSKIIIKDTEWKYLENTEDNRITLITCVENKPEYRRCIQAIEAKIIGS